MSSLFAGKFFKRLKRVLVYGIGCIFFLLIAGVIFQLIAERKDKMIFSYPGKMINVGDHQLHIQVQGAGAPVVILEAASDGSSANWVWIMDEISRVTTVCAYDRAGHGWSEQSKGPGDAIYIAAELHTLLSKANVQGPLILVGHSAGGLFIKSYQQQFPTDVAGMVLVDADNENEVVELPGFNEQLKADQHFAGIMSMLAGIGIPRLIFSMNKPAPDLPDLQGQQIRSFWSSAKHWQSLNRELDARLQTNKQVAEGRKELSIPLEIISAGRQSADWLKLQKEMESLSTNSRHTIIDSASHLSLVLNKNIAKYTSEAIIRVIEAVRSAQKK
jgi:pimeloyl-ACP methyl ester carboxylesterase